MAVYLIILASIPLLALIMKPAQSRMMRILYVWIVFGSLALLAMFRGYTVGVDTNQFVSVYENVGLNPAFSLDEYRYEPGFTILCKILNGISPEPQLLLIVTGAFIIFAVGYTVFQLSSDVALSAFVFVAMTTYGQYLNIMRQAIAIGFILIGYTKYVKQKWWIALLLFYCATLFHSSAWLVLIAFAITFIPFKKSTMYAYLVAITVMFAFSNRVTRIITIILRKEQFYDPNHSGSNYFGALIQLIFVLCITFMCFFYMRIDSGGNSHSTEARLYRHSLMLWLMFTAMGVKVEVMGRLSYYFGAIVMLIIPYALQRAKPNERFWVRIMFCSVCLAYFLIVEINRPEWHGVVPYNMNYDGLCNVFKDILPFFVR